MAKRVVILGAGESGTGAAILAYTKGFETFVSDFSVIKENYKQELNHYAIKWEEKKHTYDKILNADIVIKSPGIADTVPIIQQIKSKNIPILSEIEFAGRYSSAKMICITGSNGKTTTTSLLYHIFNTAHKNVGLAGNIGLSLARQVALDSHDYYIIELSSFQLDNMYQFKADIAILLNITPDHLDRYDYCMNHYIDAKFKVTQNQTAEDYFIYWKDDPILKAEVAKRIISAQKIAFSTLSRSNTFANTDQISACNNMLCIDRSKIKLNGQHNLYNAMAAISAAYLAGINKQEIEQGLDTFTGVEHRLEYVTTLNGVQYINDSKATNVDSCSYALQAMNTPTILILGGKDKGNDYSLIADLILRKCKGLIFLGADNEKLHHFFDSFGLPIADAKSMPKAIHEARRMAKPGDTILLSPCCASFDLFNSYEHRGEVFKKTIKGI